MISRTIDRGTANGCSPTRTTSTGRIASVSGSEIEMRVPAPGSELISIRPFSFWMLLLTTSMPTPRPETLDTSSLVEKPGMKIRCSACLSSSALAASMSSSPFSTALRRRTSGLIPRPSSLISMTIWSPAWRADRRTVPLSGLPDARRSSGDSMPWSAALRTRCTSGSFNSSTIVLSSSVSSPKSSRSSSLPNCRARSRAMRGYFWNRRPTGCMRVFITAFCRSPTSRSSWLTASSSARNTSCDPLPCMISERRQVRRFLVSPISPDRLSTWSSRAVSMRIVFSLTICLSVSLRPARSARTPGWSVSRRPSGEGAAATGAVAAGSAAISTGACVPVRAP